MKESRGGRNMTPIFCLHVHCEKRTNSERVGIHSKRRMGNRGIQSEGRAKEQKNEQSLANSAGLDGQSARVQNAGPRRGRDGSEVEDIRDRHNNRQTFSRH
jgi:hypothetical protein